MPHVKANYYKVEHGGTRVDELLCWERIAVDSSVSRACIMMILAHYALLRLESVTVASMFWNSPCKWTTRLLLLHVPVAKFEESLRCA